MNDVNHQLNDNRAPPQPDSTAKLLLLQRHQAYLAKVDRITLVNRALCLGGLVAGGITLGLVNVPTACLLFLGVFLLGFLWRVELSLATRRLKKLEEALARAGGGEWEDRYIRAKGELVGNDEFDRFLLCMEPLVWCVIAGFLFLSNGLGLVAKYKAEKENAAVTMLFKQGSQRP